MKDGKLIVGQIGCGAFAKSQDFPNFKRNEKTEMKWCCDISAEGAREAADMFGIPEVTTDFNEVINDPEVDLIKIATSHEVHLPIIEAAAARGVHVFCEKPMAMEREEALKIIAAVRRGGIKLCVDLNRRMAPSMHALKAAWQAHRANPKHQPWRFVETDRELLPEEKNAHFLINIQDESSSYRMVHLDPMRGGGVVIGECVHWIDLACWMFAPQYPVELVAWGSSRMSHGINIKFSGGDTATINFSCSGTFDYPKEMFELTSDAALFRNLFFVENRYYGVPGCSGEVFPMQFDGMKDEVPEEGFEAFINKTRLRNEKLSGNLKDFQYSAPFAVDKGHYNMLDTFVDAILNDRPSPCDEIAGFMSTYLAKLAIQSMRLKQALPVPVEEITPVMV